MEKMHKAKIFHSSPKEAAKFLNKIENNIDHCGIQKQHNQLFRIRKITHLQKI